MNLLAGLAIALIRGYRRFLSPLKRVLLGPTAGCRFVPTCSKYAIICFRIMPFHKACWQATKRICRCHPWGGMGYDPVPGTRVAYFEEDEEAEDRPKSLKDVL